MQLQWNSFTQQPPKGFSPSTPRQYQTLSHLTPSKKPSPHHSSESISCTHRQGHGCFLYASPATQDIHPQPLDSVQRKRKMDKMDKSLTHDHTITEPSVDPVMVVMWGAHQGVQDDMWQFHFKTKTWSQRPWTLHQSEHTSFMCGPKAFFGHCLNPSSTRVYVLGGYEKKQDQLCVTNEASPNEIIHFQLWEYHMNESTFYAVRPREGCPSQSSLFAPRMAHTLSFIPEEIEPDAGMLVVFGGETVVKNEQGALECKRYNDVATFHLATQQWRSLTVQGPSPSAREGHSVVHVKGKSSSKGMLVFYGGSEWLEQTSCFRKSSSVFYLDLDKHQWIVPAVKGSQPPGRSHHSAVLWGSKMIIYGGYVDRKHLYSDIVAVSESVHISADALSKAAEADISNTQVTDDLWIYDIDTCEWEELSCTHRPPPRASHSAVLLGNQMIVMGGDVLQTLPCELTLYSIDVAPALPIYSLSVQQQQDRGWLCCWVDPFDCLFHRHYRVYVWTAHQERQQVYQGNHCEASIPYHILPHTAYYFQMVAYNAYGESSVWDGTTLPPLGILDVPHQEIQSCVTLTTDRKILPCPTQVWAKQHENTVILEWTSLDPKAWTASDTREYQVQVKCVFDPDLFDTPDAHEMVSKKRKRSSTMVARLFDKHPWTPLSIVSEIGNKTQKMRKEWTLEELKTKAALSLFDTRVLQHIQPHRRSSQQLFIPSWPPTCYLYYRFRIQARDDTTASSWVEFDIQVMDASLVEKTVETPRDALDQADQNTPATTETIPAIKETTPAIKEFTENTDPLDPWTVFADEWYLNLGFGDSIQVYCEDEWWECQVVNYIRVTSTNQIAVFFYYKGYTRGTGAGYTVLTLSREDIADIMEKHPGNMKKVFQAQQAFFKESVCIRPHIPKSRCKMGPALSTLFVPGDRACVFPKGFGEAQLGKRVIIERRRLEPRRM